MFRRLKIKMHKIIIYTTLCEYKTGHFILWEEIAEENIYAWNNRN
jgi:hypothetical protein